ncbi:putative uncharacterized protein DDB_G0291608 [Folsomia candida]|nr:putative uncharacterized protein DDB_G0291608 [Folsomia candida]XP_021943820.1 putative uncharacterized protein DDB_G0291608 [Folsomia candida]XP_035701898.1 putative uncharacterized protein DDB_G0291608 [Folsomia candida]XP_035701899.1 putative uncharacterized protein DDB_G0291608 [Folsomia candida]
MISATSLNAPSPLNKGHQIPLGLENGRLRVDSQKFLVPSLPVSARAGGGGHSADPKRRERSIINGTAHPAPPTDYSHHQLHHHHQQQQQQQHSLSHNNYQNHINGFRSSYPHGTGVRDHSPSSSPHNNNNNHSKQTSSPHHQAYLHLNHSPRKDAHSPMYAGEVPGHSPGAAGGNYSRSSMPIPCSSPAQASSASPKGSHSHSPSSSGAIISSSGNYSPKLPGPAMLPPLPSGGGGSELSPLAAAGRLYPGFPPPHPSVAAHLSPAFYAAAAAAAASHSLPYPMFGSPYNPHSHSAAAASAYLDSFHSALVHRGSGNNEIQQRSRSPSPSPPSNRSLGGAYHSAQPPHPQQHQSHNMSSNGPNNNNTVNSSNNTHPNSTSVTSLHNKLIESTTSDSRHGYNAHHHVSSGQFSPQSSSSMSGISKGGPLGISGGIMNLPSSSRLPNGISPHKHNASQQPENLVVHRQSIPPLNGMNGFSLSSKQWLEQHGINPNDPMNRKLILELEARQMQKEHPLKQLRMPPQSPPQDMSVQHSQKIQKSISFASDTYPPSNHNNNSNSSNSSSSRYPNPNNNHHPSHHPYAHIMNNGHHQVHGQSNSQSNNNAGILTDSNHAKKQVNSSNNNYNNNNHHLPNLVHVSHPPPPNNHHHHHHHHSGQSSGQQFLPPSPKKRGAATQWNFAVPANPASKVDLLPPPAPPPASALSHNLNAEQIKYLNSNLNHKPSNNQSHSSLPVPNSPSANSSSYHPQSSGQSAQQHSYPSSPRSGPSTPKSPSVHQVKFSFSSGSSKENQWSANKQGAKSGVRNDSSSSSSSNEGNVPWPVEQMPILEAFRRGSLIKLANGDLRPVEDLKTEDFIQAVANLSGTLKIIHCTVLSIQQSDAKNGNSLCKVTMTVGSQLQNQQVVVPSTPEQPFFVLGRGWSSLSPKTTEKLLQLPCSPLAVGDICITLSKSTPHLAPVQAPKSHNNHVPKSPRGRKPGSGRNGVNPASSPTAKQRCAQQVSSSLIPSATKPAGEIHVEKPTSNSEPIKRHSMGPPLTTGVTNSSVITTNMASSTSSSTTVSTAAVVSSITEVVKLKEEDVEELEDNRPPSPKRRRWSAPEPEIPVSTPPPGSSVCDKSSIKEKEEQKSEAISLQPAPSSPKTGQKTPPPSTPAAENKDDKDEQQRPPSDADDKRNSDHPLETDVNSNVNVKDNVSSAMDLDQRGSTDAQSAVA